MMLKQTIPIMSAPPKGTMLIEFNIIISLIGKVKYTSSDAVHAARFKSSWGGTLYKVKEYNLEAAKEKALQKWNRGERGTVL
jgi:hypothetical protein